METLTAKGLEEVFGADVYKASNYAFSSALLPCPERLHRPILKTNPTSTEVREYASLLEKYESETVTRKEIKRLYDERHHEISSIVEEYVREISGLNTIPQQYRDKVWGHAWSQGHSNGYSEVYNYLLELIEIFDV